MSNTITYDKIAVRVIVMAIRSGIKVISYIELMGQRLCIAMERQNGG